MKKMLDEFKEKYGVECFAAIHHNKRKTNLHIHMIFAERKRLDQPEEKTATRNMFYDEQGRHVRTKKEILDSDGNIRKGCKIIKKGEVYERKIFTIKDSRFKQESFLDEAKVFYTDLINQMVIDDKDRLSIFDKNGPYLATKKVGKNNPKAEAIKAESKQLGAERTPQPKPSVLASKYSRLKEINSRLKEQNKAIFEREKKRDKLKKELSESTGIFKGGRRKELQQEIDSIDNQISNMKKRLSSIVREYKFDSVQAFYKELNAAKKEYLEYQAARAEYEKIYGKKVADFMSVRDRLKQKEQEVKRREAGRDYRAGQKDKGAR